MRKLLRGLMILLACPVALAAEPAPVRAFKSFSLIQRRNIFDPARKPYAPPAPAAPKPAPAPRVEFVVVTGTISYDGKAYAFLASSDPAHGPVLSLDDTIAGHTVVGITTTNLVLETESGRVAWAVGVRMERNGAAWHAVAAAAPQAGATAGSTPGPAAEAGPKSVRRPVSDLMKRMMERRRKELSR